MAALADAMFDQQTRDYVTEELHGDIKVTMTVYAHADRIVVPATG